MEVGCSLLPKRNKTVRHHPRGISVKDQVKVLRALDPLCISLTEYLSLCLEFPLLHHSHCSREKKDLQENRYWLPIAETVEGLNLSFARALVRENSHSLVRHDYAVLKCKMKH